MTLPGNRFDPAEDDLMLTLRGLGRSIRGVACAMRRPASSIQSRLDHLAAAGRHPPTPQEQTEMAKKTKQPELAAPDLDTDDAPEVLQAATETLTGDMRDFLLDRLRYEQDKRPWDERSEFDQRDTVRRVEEKVREVITRAVELIAANGRRTIKATLEQVTVKDGITGKIVMSKFDEQRHALMDSTGSSVLIVVADVDEFTGERAPAAIKPDQGDLVEAAAVVHSTPDGADTPFH